MPTSHLYTGQLEAEAGLYFYGARFFDPYIGRFVSADTILPEPGEPISWDRYAYARNNPVNYTDPTGHWPEWITPIGQFSQGLLFEFARTNNWLGALVSPEGAEVLAPNGSEPGTMLAGRVVGDLLTIAVGVAEVAKGVGIAGGGAVAGCGTTLCLAAAPAIALGAVVAGYGVGTTLSGAAALGENLGIAYSNRHKNDLNPDPNATGPHSTFKRDPQTGRITNYETYEPNPHRSDGGWDTILRFDGAGKAHFDRNSGEYLLLHVHDRGTVRPPFMYEVPN